MVWPDCVTPSPYITIQNLHTTPLRVDRTSYGWTTAICSWTALTSRGGQRKQYNDALEDNLAVIHINSAELEGQATDRTSLCAFCRQWVDSFDDSRMCLTRNRPRLRKTARQARPAHPLCRRTCSWQRLQDRILLCRRTHLWREIRLVDGSVHQCLEYVKYEKRY